MSAPEMAGRRQDWTFDGQDDRLQMPGAANVNEQPSRAPAASRSFTRGMSRVKITGSGSSPHRPSRRRRHLSLPLVLLISLLGHSLAGLLLAAEAQFLFTYEINQESDDSRAPKPSLFDPSAFKIVTPSQLQSSYQKLASQQPEHVASISTLAPAAAVQATSQEQQPQQPQFHSLLEPTPVAAQQPAVSPASVLAPEPNSPGAGSFLKQTSAAIQSFAELFHLAPATSPSPPSAFKVPQTQLDQQAEARSLHEHWTQQQQKAHQPAFQSFTTSPSVAQSQGQSQSHGQTDGARHLSQAQQTAGANSPPASYWLTSNPLNGPDGNFLVEIKTNQSPSQPPQDTQANSLVDNLISLGQQQQSRAQPTPTTASSLSALHGPPSAQSSFLSTPPSRFLPQAQGPVQPKPAGAPQQQQHQVASSNIERFNQQNFRKPQQQQQHFQPQTQALHQHQARSLSLQQQLQQPKPQHSHHLHDQHAHASSQQQPRAPAPSFHSDFLEAHVQLQPPANTPENYGASSSASSSSSSSRNSNLVPAFRSAEESLLAFRQQQLSQHNQQNAQLAAQDQSSRAQGGERPPSTGNSLLDDDLGPTPSPSLHAHNPLHQHLQDHEPRAKSGNTYSVQPQRQARPPQPQAQPAQQAQHTNEIPKVSPQIYESFLLQQKDQYEKHMELLKQQQELNKLLEQKQQKQQQEADKRERKKEELDRLEARKKAQAAVAAAREQELRERKQRLEAEELRRKQARQQQEDDDKRRRAAEEERRYRELIEAREREEKRKRQEADELQAAAKRQRELKEQQERDQEEAKYRTYLRQQEELKKLLELKQREDEALARQRQERQQQASQSAGRSRANKLALEHKERGRQLSRVAASSQESRQQVGAAPVGGVAPLWGGRQTRARASASVAPLPLVDSQQLASNANGDSESTSSFSQATSTTPVSSSSTTTSSQSDPSTPPPRVGARLSGSSLRRQKAAADERLIRQKIPLYTGAGKYGLYRSEANSDELAKLLEAVSLPPTPTATTTTPTAATSTPAAGSTTTQAPTPASTSDQLGPSEALPAGVARTLTSSSLSPLLNLRELAVTQSPELAGSTGEPFSSTTIFDDDVPRRPVASGGRQTTASPVATIRAVPLRRHQPVRQPRSGGISSAASGTSTTRMSHRLGGDESAGRQAAARNSSSPQGHRGATIGLASLPADSDNDGIPGRAGREYPVLAEAPKTSFSCTKSPLNGYFADTETACQVVHLCQDGVQSSILCPNGTIFNQEKFSCQWWYEVNCARAPMFYQLNDNLYKASLAADPAKPTDDKSDKSNSSG